MDKIIQYSLVSVEDRDDLPEHPEVVSRGYKIRNHAAALRADGPYLSLCRQIMTDEVLKAGRRS